MGAQELAELPLHALHQRIQLADLGLECAVLLDGSAVALGGGTITLGGGAQQFGDEALGGFGSPLEVGDDIVHAGR